MSYWSSNAGKVYLPPSRPVARILSTDDYVQETALFFQASSDRLLTVGHPYFPVKDQTGKELVPKVSGNQFRVFRLKLPDPNRFALVDPTIYNPDKERLVWKLRGLEVMRGGPLGIGSTGHPLFNKLYDTENPTQYFQASTDNRQNTSLDPKQTQLLVVGCEPCTGSYWDEAKACADADVKKGACPPIQLVNSIIEDGDMCDIGFGAMNFDKLQQDRSGVPLDIVATVCKFPDLVKMANDPYGDGLFFFGRREQLYARHYFTRSGVVGDNIPQVDEQPTTKYVLSGDNATQQAQSKISSSVYVATPSGSLVSSDAQILNRPYWMQRAQGMNNGVLWNNNLFITVVDNTHNTNFTISQFNGAASSPPDTYKASDYNQYLRHVEEYDVSIIVQICKISLEADILAHINAMNSSILDNWNLAFVPPPATGIEDHYRFITSAATRCPDQNPPAEPTDPYDKYSFWVVDLTDRMTNDLSQTSLGRRFVYQIGLTGRTISNSIIKRKRSAATGSSKSSKKKRRV
ncbi:L1 [Gammapapillomavirus 7]|uniref:Major capsid protein L1 n=1 Tax=Gammapapillomavirus 7 TaxID=1175849 RepID=A0A2D2ALA1_9PAPI|nr:L1 [Human papillomavirus 189]ATQ38246.1 L1 [Gammapapillomavirus 7]